MADLDRTKVSFEQAEGKEPLPRQLKPQEMSPALRAVLWHVLHQQLTAATKYVEYSHPVLADPWRQMLYDKHVWRDHQPADEFSTQVRHHVPLLKDLFMNGTYVQVLGTLQWLLRHPASPKAFATAVSKALQMCHAGYRLTADGKTLLPIASEEEAQTALQAFRSLNVDSYAGARKHLTAAAERLTEGDCPNAVRESMQAVESVARVITGKSSFTEALKILEKRWKIHSALKASFGRLYDYTSAEEGIRHPLLDDPAAQVDESDALFMFSACAALITYLVRKAAANPSVPTSSSS